MAEDVKTIDWLLEPADPGCATWRCATWCACIAPQQQEQQLQMA